MPRMIISLFAGIGLAATALAPAMAQSIPAGSYQQSCTNIHVRGEMLVARCTNPQGASVRSSIPVDSCRRGDIVNANGQLACNRNGRTRYNNGGYNNGGYNNGGYNNGGYNNGGYNNGGYNNGGYNYGRNGRGIATGSYQSSCTNAYMNGPVLTASCTAPNGQRITSSVNAAQCRGADIANINGRLVCQ